jgi:hypothetical protein
VTTEHSPVDGCLVVHVTVLCCSSAKRAQSDGRREQIRAIEHAAHELGWSRVSRLLYLDRFRLQGELADFA